VGVSIGDMAAGLYLATALCAALFERSRTGQGRYIDIAMLDCQIALLENLMSGYLATGRVPHPLGTRHESIAPFAAFRAADTYLVIAAANDALFRKLCDALERPDLWRDERFQCNELRQQHADALTYELEKILSAGSACHWIDRLQNAGVPCGPLNTLADVANDPQVAARRMIVPVDGDRRLYVAGNPVRFDGMPDVTHYPAAPELDADRDRLMREFIPTEARLS
jgi:CoA:oxalate CoA-transferase